MTARRIPIVSLTAAVAIVLMAAHAAAQFPQVVRDVNGGPIGSTPVELVVVRDTLYFAADDGTGRGVELWKSDGTPDGTVIVKDIRPGSGSSSPAHLTDVNGTLLFVATDGTGGRELWRSDGTEAGTVLVKDIYPGSGSASPESLVNVNGTLFFSAIDGVIGRELWKSNGTAAGTVLVADIQPGTNTNSSTPERLTAIGEVVYFRANDGVTGVELWSSRGTLATTVMVRDIYPGAGFSNPDGLANMNGTLVFRANDGPSGSELWKSDGTTAGTVRVKDIHEGGGSSSPDKFTLVGDMFFFTAADFTAENGTNGLELWLSDGTTAGTRMVRDIWPGSFSSTPTELVNVNGILFFSANIDAPGPSPSGRELWRSDGTLEGTVLVKDVYASTYDGNPTGLVNLGGVLYFAATNGSSTTSGQSGIELWRSDGTAPGTELVTDLNPGGANSSPHELVVAGRSLYFVATEPANGEEVWRLIGPPVNPAISSIPRPLVVGGASTIAGTNLTDGSVVKLFVAAAAGPVAYGPFSPTATSPTLLTVAIPATVPLGNGFASVQVINTDQEFTASNVVAALLHGDPADNIPTITHVDGVGLGPAELSIGVAHSDVVVNKGAEVTLTGTGFNSPKVNLFTAAGNVGPLTPLGGGTATQIRVVVPAGAPTGPANFQVVNTPFDGNVQSNAVAAILGARPAITSVSVAGGTVTVNGAGFSTLSVINLFNVQGGGVVNLGGNGPSGPRVPLTIVSDTQLTFVTPLAAQAGRAFVEVLNPPFIPFSSSGNDPDGAFSFPPPAPLLLTLAHSGLTAMDAQPAPAPDARGDASMADGTSTRVDPVRWTASALAARSTRALVAGDGGVTWRATPADLAVGLNGEDVDGSLADIDFALRTRAATGELLVVENGRLTARAGRYEVGDALAVRLRGGTVEYFRNGALLWTSEATTRLPLIADTDGTPAAARRTEATLDGALGDVVVWRSLDERRADAMRFTADQPARAAGPAVVVGASIEAELVGDAALGLGQGGCEYCLVSTPGDVEVRWRGAIRGNWPSQPGARYRVEAGAVSIRFWQDDLLLDEVPRTDEPIALRSRAAAARGGVVSRTVVR